MAFVLTISVGAFAQPGPAMENVVLTARATSTIQYGGPTRAEGRSYNFTPMFFIYPDGKLDEAGAEALLQELDIQPLLDSEYGTAMVINPVGDKYAADADFEAFVNLFNASRGPGNLKVVGIGQGATFVNQVIAPKAGGQIAGILSVGGKPGKAVDAAGVPAYIAGKGAAKVAKPYQAAVAAHADEPLLKVVVNPAEKASLKEVFAGAWKEVLGRNYRYNNYNHTHYEGAQFGQYGSYELEPYLDCESLGIKRIIVEQPVGRGQRGQDAPKQLWYEYWPEELLENAPARSAPVMVLLHGNQNDPRTQAETSGFIQVAAEDRFFVVEMEWQGTPNYQAMGHDGIESVLYQLFAKYPQLDPSRVYAEGLSAGSMGRPFRRPPRQPGAGIPVFRPALGRGCPETGRRGNALLLRLWHEGQRGPLHPSRQLAEQRLPQRLECLRADERHGGRARDGLLHRPGLRPAGARP